MSRHVLGTDPRTETNLRLAIIGRIESQGLPLGTELEGSTPLPPCIQVSMRRRRHVHDGETRSGMLCLQTAGTLAASPVVRAASPIYAAEAFDTVARMDRRLLAWSTVPSHPRPNQVC
jgi:hypothetical protein